MMVEASQSLSATWRSGRETGDLLRLIKRSFAQLAHELRGREVAREVGNGAKVSRGEGFVRGPVVYGGCGDRARDASSEVADIAFNGYTFAKQTWHAVGQGLVRRHRAADGIAGQAIPHRERAAAVHIDRVEVALDGTTQGVRALEHLIHGPRNV